MLAAMRTPPPLMPALITPFDGSGELDLGAHVANISHLVDGGVEGFLIGGSTGEGPYLEADERRRLVKTAKAAAPDSFLLCGIATETLRGAMKAIDEAVDGGADAVLVVTPTTLVRHRPVSVTRYFEDVADRSPLPVFLYSVPKVTALELPMTAAIELASHDNVFGMKDSGGDPVRAESIIRDVPDAFFFYTGSSSVVMRCVAAGATGAITASANYAATLVQAVIDETTAAAEGAAVSQQALTDLSSEVEQHGVAGVKSAAAHRGLVAGSVRRPLQEVSDAVRNAIEIAVTAADLA